MHIKSKLEWGIAKISEPSRPLLYETLLRFMYLNNVPEIV